MHRVRLLAVALTLIAVASPAKPEVPPLPTVLQVLGNVTNAARPVGNALVIALNLNSLDAIETFFSLFGPDQRGAAYDAPVPSPATDRLTRAIATSGRDPHWTS